MTKTTLLAMSFEGLENVEVGRLQAFLSENGYESESIQLDGNKDIDQNYTLLDLNSRVYAMYEYAESSVYPESILCFAQLAKKIKAEIADSIIVLGSKFPSIYYKEILGDERFSGIDYIILGESEYTLASLIDCVEKNDDISEFVATHKNIASKASMDNKEILNININELPLPDRSFLYNKNFGNYYAFIYDSHGCTMKCSFCTRGQFYKFTGRSAESLFTEIEKITTESPIKCFWFTGGSGGSFEDPGGELGVKKIRDLCNLIIEDNLKVSMRVYLRSNFVAKVDIDLLKLMKKAGIHVALVGVESGNEYDLNLLKKGTNVQNNRITLKMLKEAGIYSDHFGFMMINPYSTPERLQDNFRFLDEHQPHDLDNYVHHLVVDPGTAIMKRIENDGLLIPKDDFLKQGPSYRFMDPFAAEVSEFLHKYFLIYDTETAGISTFVFNLAPFLPHGKIFEERTTSIMQKRARVYSEYFRMLYLDMDIGSCERKYDEFRSILHSFDKELALLKNALVKDLIKFKIM
ncbi:hypothetical protein A8L34_09675 [Bacillus sp. FJAT-27264]|uniref:B12-binding domain-containing radical SAM protein n=1 Tax=Paenibacillus sp. (strain DSM 101736 / FJAT-27264) TaxID=1850362 RepID=UPI00080801F3|nr:radical SAM protein [Bacillus sp. FJAT-27264]OBZ14219.1 hypothetical protein A8L34_09675 [Bacillus sp. FJAT-27264]